MPISRYEIRNEYSLADPELYRAADKDDPEAVLEGVAMAGLVGVLRQLGDLAEFAADIFHNLHEDVMATSARGHAIAVRVQQLENDIPSLERAFLSQTDHSPFFYHPGVDWHQNLRSDKNLITQGDMPRFIMDSYEECRAPPRLFLLDKFDVAGAGACLKRYTDPSFFKDETSEMTTADIHREKKIRKTKKKGPRWKNRETTEVLPSSHTKLHQLFLEERVDNGVSTPFRLAKLKRRLNGFPFNSKSGKSYMEVILKSPSPDHEVLHDMTEVSPQLKLATNDRKEFGYEIFGLRPVSPDRKSVGRKKSTRISPDIEGVTLHPPMPDPDEYPIDDLHPSIATDGISSSLDKVTGEKVVAVDAESNRERSLSGYESDEMASYTDNYVDAPSTMESELDRDFNSIHLRMKNDITLDIKMESLITDAHKEPLHSSFSDSYSTGDSTTSDVGNNSSTKEISSSASDSQNISAEKSPPECFPIKGYQCTDIPSNMIVGASSYQENADEDFSDDQHSTRMVSDDAITYSRSSDPDEVVRNCLSKPSESDEKIFTLDEEEEENVYQVIDPSLVVFDGTCTETNVITNQGSEVEQATSTLCVNESVPPLELSDPEKTLGNFELEALGSDELVSTLDDNEKLNLVIDQPCYPGAALGSQTGNVLLRSSDRELLVDEPNSESEPCLSAEHDIDQQTTDSGVKISPGLLHVDESDVEDRELADDAASTLNINNVLSTNDTLDMMPPGNQIPDEFEDEFPSVPEKSLSDYPYAANNGYSIEPKGDNLTGEWDDEDSNISIDSQNRSSCTMEASPGKGIEETSLLSACTLKVEEHSEISIDNQISMENLNLSHAVNSPDRLLDDCSVHEGDIIPEEDTAVNETLPREISEPCELEGLEGTGVSYYVSPNDSEALKSIHCTLEDLEEPAGKSDTVEIDGISRCSVSNAQEVIEITSPADMRPANEIHVLFNKFGPEDDRNKSIDITSTVSDDTSRSKLIEEHRDCSEDSGMDEFENDNNCQMECSWKMDLVEKVGPTEASASDFGTVCGNPVGSDLSNPELSGLAPISNLDLELDHSPEFVHSAKNKSPIEQCGLDREQEYFNESILENQVPYSPTLPVGNDSDELVQDNIGLPPSHLDQTLAHPVEISSELSSLLPSNYLQILDDDVGKGEHNLVSAFSPANSSSPPSIPEVSRLSNNEISVPGYPKDHFDSLSTTSNPFLETNLAGLPPLPPLPPVEWMMGKLPHALPSADEETIRNEESFPQLISLSAPTADVGSTVSTKPTHDGAPPPTASTDGIISSHEEMKNSLIELASETASNEEDPDNSCSSLDVKTSHEEMKNSLIELAAETASNEEDPDNSCSSLDVKTLHETPDHPPTIENKPRLLATPISESISTSSGAEDGAENVSQKVKFPRPRNPLVDDVSFLDKSKLRKVTERAIPEMSKVDERDSFLEQIRAKSFNLRPAMASRPSIRARGPNTNLKVVAILEKANAIRQALAGSDEDEDSWSE